MIILYSNLKFCIVSNPLKTKNWSNIYSELATYSLFRFKLRTNRNVRILINLNHFIELRARLKNKSWVPTRKRPASYEDTCLMVMAVLANTASIPEVVVMQVVNIITELTLTNTILDTSERLVWGTFMSILIYQTASARQ